MCCIDWRRRAVALAQQQSNSHRCAVDSCNRCAEMIANAFALELLQYDRGEIGVLARQNACCDIDNGDLAAKPSERLRHLAADRSAADDDQVGDRFPQIEDRFVGQIADRFDAGNRRYRRPRSRRDHKRTRLQLSSSDFERRGVDEAAAAENDVDAHRAKSLGAVVRFDALDDRRDTLHHARQLRSWIVRRQRKACGVAHHVGDARRLDQRF